MAAQAVHIQYTPTELRIIKLLSDGRAHERREVLECLLDVTAGFINMQNHIVRLRHKVRTIGQEIVCELRKGSIWYRQVILLKEIPACEVD